MANLTIDEAENRWRMVSQSLRRAFKHTPRPDDSELFPGYPDLSWEAKNYFDYLQGKTWKQVDPGECGAALLHLTVPGWRYFLPAFLLEITPLSVQALGFQFPIDACWLCPKGQYVKQSLDRIESLSLEEFRAVREYMRFAGDCNGGGSKDAWKGFWSKAEFCNFPDVC